ncbi:MAG TPA: RodZ domain-containing protein [Candidatus Angelobacter sp.]|jgi:cytoskeleton protein RodZ|nr:RodZ domain-containing protein [Candidatus Angelobacter sp.]
MGVFGDRMRREREMRGVTLEEISESTKISKRALQALEEEDFDLLPGGIFNKGFVRAYARFLGIDEEQAVADFIAADTDNHEPQEENKFPLNMEDRAVQPPLNPKRSRVPVLLALLLLAAAAGGWTVWNKYRWQHGANESQGSEASVPDNRVPGQLLSGHETQKNAIAAGTAASPSGDTTNLSDPGQKTDSSTPSNNDSEAALNDATNKQSASSSADFPTSDSESVPVYKQPFTISIKANEDSWISIVADGKPKIEGILNAEKQKSVTAKKELVLVTGNAGGIEVSYNGKPIAPLGKNQQKRTITFTAQGLKE